MAETTFSEPTPPTGVGQRVRQYGYGGEVAQWMEEGTVTGFNRSGFPKVLVDDPPGRLPTATTVTDRYGCFRQVGADGRWLRTTVVVRMA